MKIVEYNNGDLKVVSESNVVYNKNESTKENKMTRIRYSKNDRNQLVTKELLVGNEMVTGVINLSDMSYSVVTTDGTVRSEGTASTVALAQKALKQQLKALGLVLHDEIRNRKQSEETVETPVAQVTL